MDVVYVVREAEDNEGLRYSLRSLVNLSHDRVFIAGYRPSWVSDEVTEIPVQQDGTKWQNSTANLRAACLDDDVSEDFVYFNDDFFVKEYVQEMPILHRGPMRDVLAYYVYTKSRYAQGMRETYRLLRKLGYSDPLSYEMHAPMPLNKGRMTESLRAADEAGIFTAPHKRTLYGNMWDIGGVETPDVKVPTRGGALPEGPFVSTSRAAWAGNVGDAVRRAFSDACEYER